MNGDTIAIDLVVRGFTPKAVLTSLCGEEFWLPRSQIEYEPPLARGIVKTFRIPRWLAEKHLPDVTKAGKPIFAIGLAEAREIFGLEQDFTEMEVRLAYRRLIERAHPDAGGSEGLAKLINVIRDELVGLSKMPVRDA